MECRFTKFACVAKQRQTRGVKEDWRTPNQKVNGTPAHELPEEPNQHASKKPRQAPWNSAVVFVGPRLFPGLSGGGYSKFLQVAPAGSREDLTS